MLPSPHAPQPSHYWLALVADATVSPQCAATLHHRSWLAQFGESLSKPSPQPQAGYDRDPTMLASSPHVGLGCPVWSHRRRTWPRVVVATSASSTTPVTLACVVVRVVGADWPASWVGMGLGWQRWLSSTIAAVSVREGWPEHLAIVKKRCSEGSFA